MFQHLTFNKIYFLLFATIEQLSNQSVHYELHKSNMLHDKRSNKKITTVWYVPWYGTYFIMGPPIHVSTKIKNTTISTSTRKFRANPVFLFLNAIEAEQAYLTILTTDTLNFA